MISVSGLSDDIYTAMTENAQQRVIEKIMHAASNGQTSVTVRGKGLTPAFLAQLDSEGIESLAREDGSVKLFWEF